MSFYIADWYQGIIKPEFEADVEKIWMARDWSAAEGKTLSAIVSKGLGRKTAFIDRCEFIENIPDNKYEKETRMLSYGMSGNQYGEWGRRIYNMYSFVLPVITERVIAFYGWTEDMDEANTQMAQFFQRDMHKTDRLLKEHGLESFLERFWLI